MDRATRRGAGELLAIVWDMDGTLIDSATVVPDAYIRAITRLGGPTLTREAVIAAYGLGPPAIMLAHLLGRATTDADVQEYLACLRAGAAAARPYPGIEATLEGLRGRVEMGVFTGANHAGALILLDSAGLTGHFTVVVGGDEVEHQKPAPDSVLRACRSLGVAPASAAYVGDSASDLEAARSSGARAFAAGWGHLYGPDSPADLVLHRPEELLALLGVRDQPVADLTQHLEHGRACRRPVGARRQPGQRLQLQLRSLGGFDMVAAGGEEVRQPERNLPRAILLTLIGVVGMYLLVTLVALGSVPASRLGASTAPLAEAASAFGGAAARRLIVCCALLTTAAAPGWSPGSPGCWPAWPSTRVVAGASALGQRVEQPVDQLGLGRENLLAGGRHVEPLRPVDLGELALAAGARRPLDGEGVAGDRLGIEIAGSRPGAEDLAAPLPDRAQLQQVLVPEPVAGLLLQFAQRGLQRVVALVVLALGDRPGAQVLLGPERATRVDQEHLDVVPTAPVQQDAGAHLGHTDPLP